MCSCEIPLRLVAARGLQSLSTFLHLQPLRRLRYVPNGLTHTCTALRASSTFSSNRQRGSSAADSGGAGGQSTTPTVESAAPALPSTYPSDFSGARRLVHQIFQDFSAAIHKPFVSLSEIRSIRAQLARITLHYQRTNPTFFGSETLLFVLRLAAADNFHEVSMIESEMNQKSLRFETPHYASTLHALSLSSDRNDQERAFYYFSRAMRENLVDDVLWSDLFAVCSRNQASQRLFDLWWRAFVDEGPKQLPIAAVQHALEWCSRRRDVERALQVWAKLKQSVGPQNILLSHYVILLRTVANMKHDGGIRAKVLEAMQKNLSPDAIRMADWGTIIGLCDSLSLDSTMGLIQSRAAGKEQDVPFACWLLLLRRLALQHRLDEAESLFLFLRKRFRWTLRHKEIAVVTLMKMYATLLGGPDPDSCVALYVAHVVHCPEGEPRVAPAVAHFRWLLRAAAADADMASNLFLEAAACGIALGPQEYEMLFAATAGGYSAVALRKKLPPVESAALDASLRVPAEADAHAIREEALKARGKTVVNSTS